MIEKININEIKLNPNNPRIIKDEKFNKLVKSIKEFPEMLDIRPIVIDENGFILGGNMRFKASKDAGLKEISIIKAINLTDSQKREFIVKDNSSFGDWDWEALGDWDTNDLIDWGLDIDSSFNIDDDGDNEDDRDIKINSLFQITIDFENEEKLKENYERLLLLGYDCKIIII
jgi:ParB-like chromosome segregation protein Spo0J